MLLKVKSTNHMIEVSNIMDLMNLNCDHVEGCEQEGEDIHAQDTESYRKSDLVFLSGEELPRCWTDPRYRYSELNR